MSGSIGRSCRLRRSFGCVVLVGSRVGLAVQRRIVSSERVSWGPWGVSTRSIPTGPSARRPTLGHGRSWRTLGAPTNI
eukprot:7238438-Pyramimonas_sp.AAC.1